MSRVTPRAAILSERGTTVPATVTSDTTGKLRMWLDVPIRIISDLLLFKAVIDLYEPVSDSILKPDLVSWYK